MYSVPEWRRFIAARRQKVRGDITQKEELQILLLQARLDRERFELAERDHTIREQIADEIGKVASSVLQQLKYALDGLPNQLAPRLEGLAVMEIFHRLRDALNARLRAAADALDKIAKDSRRKVVRKRTEGRSNVVPFVATGGGTQ